MTRDPVHFAEHAAIAADPARWASETIHVGLVVDDLETIELANCRACMSTIARVIAPVGVAA